MSTRQERREAIRAAAITMAVGACLTASPLLVRPAALHAQEIESRSGMVLYRSNADFATTVARVEGAVKARGLFVMRVMDHSAAAAQFGRTITPNTMVLFGNPQIGSQVMACAPRAGIDLPQKLLVWEEDRMVMVGYNDPEWLRRRHAIVGCDAVLGQVAENLRTVAEVVAKGGS